MTPRSWLQHRRLRVSDVPGEHGEPTIWGGVQACWAIEPMDVEQSRWEWRVWLEFLEGEHWCPDTAQYEASTWRRPGSHEVRGRRRDKMDAVTDCRIAVDDARRRIAAGEMLRNARDAARSTGGVEL